MARILFIEDDAEFRNEIAAFLAGRGHEVIEASNGSTGLDLIYRATPDLVLCDRMLPDVSGVEALAELRRRPPHPGIKFVFLTALCDRRDMMAVADLNPDAYLVKPIQLERLQEVVESLVLGGEVVSAAC